MLVDVVDWIPTQSFLQDNSIVCCNDYAYDIRSDSVLVVFFNYRTRDLVNDWYTSYKKLHAQ